MSPNGEKSPSPARFAAWRRLCALDAATGPATNEPAPWADLGGRRDRAQASRLVRGVLRNLAYVATLHDEVFEG
jgi:hypothetical protein